MDVSSINFYDLIKNTMFYKLVNFSDARFTSTTHGAGSRGPGGSEQRDGSREKVFENVCILPGSICVSASCLQILFVTPIHLQQNGSGKVIAKIEIQNIFSLCRLHNNFYHKFAL